jgi:tungstate transport system substrate-binding protein
MEAKKMKKNVKMMYVMLAALMLSGFSVFARGAKEQKPSDAVPVKGKIILSTTTSTQDSGLLGFLLPVFTKETGWEVDTIAVGTGAALKMGQDGEADVLLVHAKAQEEKFVADGFGVKRFDVMYNDFLVVGPDAKSPVAYNQDVKATFKAIADKQLAFASRGDKSGTHTMELSLWKAVGADPEKLANYISTGQGMGATLQIADEKGAYTLTDRATWLTFMRDKKINLPAVCEKDPGLLNYYGVIAVNPKLNNKINAEGGQAFVDWMLKDSTQKIIGQYGVAEFGGALFTPNAGANK